MKLVFDEFQAWFGLPNLQYAIDGTHIVKPSTYPKDYYYHKFGGYSVVAQAIINCKKNIIDVFMGLLGSVNDSRVLHKSTLYKNAQYHGLFASNNSTFQHALSPYLLGNKRYPLIIGIMILFKEKGQYIILELLYNQKQKEGYFVVGNAFNILRKTFMEFLTKTKLHISFVLDVFTAHCLLHNLL